MSDTKSRFNEDDKNNNEQRKLMRATRKKLSRESGKHIHTRVYIYIYIYIVREMEGTRGNAFALDRTGRQYNELNAYACCR